MSTATPRRSFVWTDHGRFVEVHPVKLGWLVVWGHYEDLGATRIDAGNAMYRDLPGARRRLADCALEITRKPTTAAQAVFLFDRFPFPDHAPAAFRDPL